VMLALLMLSEAFVVIAPGNSPHVKEVGIDKNYANRA